MNEYKIKEAMEQIHITDQMQEDIIRNVQKRVNPVRHGRRKWKLAMTAAAVAAAASISILPVRALVTYYRNAYENPNIESRVETTLSGEEIQELFRMFDIQDSNGVNADTYSRDYIGTENERHQKLWKEYKEGTAAPKGKIKMVDSEEEAEKYDFCYLTTLSKYYFPQDREMTDEELLQKIDLQLKCAYVIEKRTFEQQ